MSRDGRLPVEILGDDSIDICMETTLLGLLFPLQMAPFSPRPAPAGSRADPLLVHLDVRVPGSEADRISRRVDTWRTR